MKLSRQFDFAVGGQAVIEGVMMRSPQFYTVSVRDPEGKIRFKQAPFRSWTAKLKALNLPFLRGVVHLIESMVLGTRVLNYSNAVFLGEDEERQVSGWRAALEGFFVFLSFAFSMVLALGLLKFLPLWLAGQAADLWPAVSENYLLFNAIDGLTKIVIFLGYIVLISLFKDIRRVFEYHGAEHKTIWAYEQGLKLTVANARKQTRFHPRCGTSFLFIVILMSIFVYTVIPPAEAFWGMLGQRVAVIPIIAGLSYELLKLSGKFQDQAWVRLLSLPGLWIQKLTTREPDDKQLEVALHALKHALEVEGQKLSPA